MEDPLMQADETSPSPKGMRPAVLVSGAVLWLLAAALGFAIFEESRKQTDATHPTAEDKAAIDPEDPTASTVEGEKSPAAAKNAKPEIRMTWSSEGIDDFSFTERSGRTVTKADLLGKPWAVCFTFSRCAGPCPKVMGRMHILQDELKDVDVRLVTLTVDPKNDTQELLRQWADVFEADPEKWLFLTGAQDEIYRLINRSFRMPVQEMTGKDRLPGYEVLHSSNVMLVDASGRVLEKYNGTIDTEMVALREALKKEAARVAKGQPSKESENSGSQQGDADSDSPPTSDAKRDGSDAAADGDSKSD
jgi:protein SCO1/2/putative membrane protein